MGQCCMYFIFLVCSQFENIMELGAVVTVSLCFGMKRLLEGFCSVQTANGPIRPIVLKQPILIKDP